MSSARLAHLTNDRFVENWTRLFGEPPAALLEDRQEMLKIAVEVVPELRGPFEHPLAPKPRAMRSQPKRSYGRE
jgi:hypothetical protein